MYIIVEIIEGFLQFISHGMKIWQTMIEKKKTSETIFTRKQLWFMLERLTISPIIPIKQIVYYYCENKKKLCMVFIGSKKTYDRVPKIF